MYLKEKNVKNMNQNKKRLTMKELKKQVKGITLIALVVTIIVLLILAGIAISLTIGEGGIFSRAQTAANTWRNAESNEQLAMGELEDWMEKYANGNGGSEDQSSKTLVEAFNAGEIKVGDYVNYKNPTSGNYTSKANKNGVADQNFTVDTSMQWRVLGLSEDGKHVLLVSNSPIKRGEVSNPNTENNFSGIEEYISKDNYFYMYGAEGAYYCIDNEQGEGELDNICAIYKNDLADEARSMTTEDINNLLGLQVIEEGEHAGIYKKSDVEAGNYISQDAMKSIGYDTLGDTFTWGQNHNTPASSLGLEAAPSTESAYPLTAYGYNYVNLESSQQAPEPNTEIGITTDIYNMLFKGTEDYDEKPYWLASSGSYAYSSNVGFGPGAVFEGYVYRDYGYLFDSYGYEDYFGLGVRPVVSLKSGVTVNDIQVISGTEDTEKWPEHGHGLP